MEWQMWPSPIAKLVGTSQHIGAKPTDWLSHGKPGLHYTWAALGLALAETPSP